MNPTVQLGGQIAIALASAYVPGAAPAVSLLTAAFAAVNEYNKNRGRDAAYVPTAIELNAFIAEREAKRIPTDG